MCFSYLLCFISCVSADLKEFNWTFPRNDIYQPNKLFPLPGNVGLQECYLNKSCDNKAATAAATTLTPLINTPNVSRTVLEEYELPVRIIVSSCLFLLFA